MSGNTTNKIQKNTAAKISNNCSCCNFSDTSFYNNSLDILPTLVTENVTVIAVTDYGGVAESSSGHSVVVSDCKASVGDLVSATFYVPAMDQNGYYDGIQDKLEMINP